MAPFEIVFSEKANEHIQNLVDAIFYEYKAPLTAFEYLQGLLDEIMLLKSTAETFTIQQSNFFRQYGIHVRRVNYKKMAIIYSVVHQTVYIQAIIPSSTIKA